MLSHPDEALENIDPDDFPPEVKARHHFFANHEKKQISGGHDDDDQPKKKRTILDGV